MSNLSNPGDSYKKDLHKKQQHNNVLFDGWTILEKDILGIFCPVENSGNAICLDFNALSSNSVFLVLMHLGPKKKL